MTVAQASTTTTVTSSPNPSVAGEPVTLTATVSPVSPGSGTPTGTVIFSNGSTQLGTETLSDGVATLTTTTLPTGTDSITAVYSGDTNFIASTSTAINQVVTAGDHVRHGLGLESPIRSRSSRSRSRRSSRWSTGLGTPTGTVTFFSRQRDQPGHRAP